MPWNLREEKDLEAKQKSQNFTLTKECSFAKRLPNFVFASVEVSNHYKYHCVLAFKSHLFFC